MKLKVYWTLLVVTISMVVGGTLFLIAPWEDKALIDEPEYSSNEVIIAVTSYLLETEFIYETPSPLDFNDYSYVGEGKWSGKYSGPSAYGVNSIIVWNFYEQVEAVEIVQGYPD